MELLIYCPWKTFTKWNIGFAYNSFCPYPVKYCFAKYLRLILYLPTSLSMAMLLCISVRFLTIGISLSVTLTFWWAFCLFEGFFVCCLHIVKFILCTDFGFWQCIDFWIHYLSNDMKHFITLSKFPHKKASLTATNYKKKN